MNSKTIIEELKNYCAKRMEASFATSDRAADNQQLLGEEQAIRDTIDLFLGKIRGLEHDIQNENGSSAYSHVEQYEHEINAGRSIAVIWSISDVQMQAEIDGIELSDEQAVAVLQNIEQRHDAEVGVNWDVISIHIDAYLRTHKK